MEEEMERVPLPCKYDKDHENFLISFRTKIS